MAWRAFAANQIEVVNKNLSENGIYWQQQFQAEPELELNWTITVKENISFEYIEYMLQLSDWISEV